MPVADASANGLITRFTPAVCCPRAALLTCRNHTGRLGDHRDRHVGAGTARASQTAARCRVAQAQRLRDRPIRQVSRGAGWHTTRGTVRPWAVGGGSSLRRLYRRENEPVRRDLPGHVPVADRRLTRATLHEYIPTDDRGWSQSRDATSRSRLLRARAAHAPHHVSTSWSDSTRSVRPVIAFARRLRPAAQLGSSPRMPSSGSAAQIAAGDDIPDR